MVEVVDGETDSDDLGLERLVLPKRGAPMQESGEIEEEILEM